MNLSQAFGGLALVQHCLNYSGATLSMYSGTMPASPETALSGNTLLYSFPFNTPGFAITAPTFSGGFSSLAASLGAGTYAAAGTVSFARATIKASIAARANTTAYTRGTFVTASSNLYVCTVGGTTSSTSTLTTANFGIPDGSSGWDYVGASTLTVLADFTVGTSGTDIIIGNTTILNGVPVSVTSFTLQVPTL